MNRKIINEQIGQNIKAIRKRQKKTQQNVAEKIGISRSVYARYETGEIEIPVSTFVLIIQELHTDASKVLGDSIE